MTLAHLHPEQQDDIFSNLSEFHPFVRAFLKCYGDTVIRNEYMGGLGMVPVIEYMGADGALWTIPLMWNPEYRWYELAKRHPHDNTLLIALDMGALQSAYPTFYQMSQTMYSTVR